VKLNNIIDSKIERENKPTVATYINKILFTRKNNHRNSEDVNSPVSHLTEFTEVTDGSTDNKTLAFNLADKNAQSYSQIARIIRGNNRNIFFTDYHSYLVSKRIYHDNFCPCLKRGLTTRKQAKLMYAYN